MKVKGLDGREYSWKLTSRAAGTAKSQYHIRARELLKNLFPFDSRLEEVSLPGSAKLTADFVVPSRKLMVEVQGEQHYKHVGHFHGAKHGEISLGLNASNKRDADKRHWCELNGITLVELPFDETDEQWTERILK